MGNISTRAFNTGGGVVIAGFILGGDSGNEDPVILRGIGPSLAQAGLSPVLDDPALELYDSNGALVDSNNDWQGNAAEAAMITAAGLTLPDPLESGIATTLAPGAYTALFRDNDFGTGFGLVEVYDKPVPSPTP